MDDRKIAASFYAAVFTQNSAIKRVTVTFQNNLYACTIDRGGGAGCTTGPTVTWRK